MTRRDLPFAWDQALSAVRNRGKNIDRAEQYTPFMTTGDYRDLFLELQKQRELEDDELPRSEKDLRFLTSFQLELFTGARGATITEIRLQDVTFIWIQSEKHGWVPGALLDYRSLKWTPIDDRVRCDSITCYTYAYACMSYKEEKNSETRTY